MLRKLSLVAFSCLAIATAASAQEGCPLAPDGNDVEAHPVAWRAFADVYDTAANAHLLFGSADPFAPSAISSAACPGGTAIGWGGYVGSVEGPFGAGANTDANDFFAVFVFNGDDVVASARKHAVRFRNIQNFTGIAYELNVKLLENRGDTLGSIGARGIFNRPPVAAPSNNETTGGLGPFGAPVAGVLGTVATDVRGDRGNGLDGSCTIPANGAVGIHDSGQGIIYATFDRSADIAIGSDVADPGLRSVAHAIRTAQNSGVTYTTCRHSCTAPSPLIRNVDCDVTVTNPLYVGVSAVAGGSEGAAGRLQDTLAVDNILHLMGDSDFCGELVIGETCSVSFVSKL